MNKIKLLLIAPIFMLSSCSDPNASKCINQDEVILIHDTIFAPTDSGYQAVPVLPVEENKESEY